jgi:hypothetical protein
MGNSTSAIIKTIDREKLFAATKSTRILMDTLLEYLLQKLNMKDFFILSSPTECKKYVMALAGTLDTIFYELKIVPDAKKDGTIYFRPTKELTEPTGDRQKATRQSLCVILSYFYTRIFQIFGALALSVMDEASSIIDSGLTGAIKGDMLRLRGYDPTDIRVKYGGNLDNLGSFSFLKDYLSKEETQYGHLFKSAPRTMSFLKKSGSVDWGAGPGTRGTLYIGLKGVKNKFIEIDLIATASGGIASNTIRINVGDLRVAGVKYNIPAEVTEKTLYIEREMPGAPYVMRDDTTKNAVEGIYEVVEKVVRWVQEKDYGRDLSEPAVAADKYYTTTYTEGVLDPLRVDKTIYALTKYKPLAHCVARAMQLLNAKPIEGKEAFSSVCKRKFLETSTGVARSGLPAPGEPIDKSPGLYALNQLFFDAVKYGLPEISMKSTTLEQYRAFLKEMAVAFNDTGMTDPEKMSDVKSRQGCESGADMSIAVKPEAVGSIYAIIKRLYEVQLAHTANAGKIIGQLFLIKYEKSIGRYSFSIHPNIFKKGIIEIERINAEARAVLINYYSSCEGLYKIGKERVLASKAGVGPGPAPAGPPGLTRLSS